MSIPDPRNTHFSPDAPIITNSVGGSQSDVGCRLDLVCPKTMITIGQILNAGATKYGESNWRKISVEDHLNHALVHIYGYLDGNTEDDHLGHAFTRLMFALSQSLNKNSQLPNAKSGD